MEKRSDRVNLEKKTYEEVRDELFALTEAAKEKGSEKNKERAR